MISVYVVSPVEQEAVRACPISQGQNDPATLPFRVRDFCPAATAGEFQ
jgi:hypothetical protein